jgi:hypothetical protein
MSKITRGRAVFNYCHEKAALPSNIYNQENKAKIEKKMEFSVVLEKGPESTFFLAPCLGYICKLLVQ